MSEASTHLEINRSLKIPLAEISITFVRSGGPGGQHVNKTSTQAELLFDLEHSPSLTERDRAWLMEKLRTKLDSRGVLHVTAQEFRSQLRNRNAAIERLQEILRAALVRPKVRKTTKPGRAARERRLTEKKRHSDKKKTRSFTE